MPLSTTGFFRYEPTLVVSLTTLRDFLARRKAAYPRLSSWKAVIMNVEYGRVEEPLIQEIRTLEVAGDIRLGNILQAAQLSIPYLPSLDQGIVRGISSTISAVVNDMTYLS